MSKHTTPDGFPVADYQVSPPPHPSDHLRGYVPSAVLPHIEALQKVGIYDRLSVDDQGLLIKLMQQAYENGRAAQGAEKIDVDAVWVDGIGGLECQPDGSWKLTMPDNNASMAAAALGSKGGSVTSRAKAAAARANGRKGGRPRKQQI